MLIEMFFKQLVKCGGFLVDARTLILVEDEKSDSEIVCPEV